MTSTGYGDVTAHNEGEMLFASVVMIFARLLFGFVLGNITSTLVRPCLLATGDIRCQPAISHRQLD